MVLTKMMKGIKYNGNRQILFTPLISLAYVRLICYFGQGRLKEPTELTYTNRGKEGSLDDG